MAQLGAAAPLSSRYWEKIKKEKETYAKWISEKKSNQVRKKIHPAISVGLFLEKETEAKGGQWLSRKAHEVLLVCLAVPGQDT